MVCVLCVAQKPENFFKRTGISILSIIESNLSDIKTALFFKDAFLSCLLCNTEIIPDSTIPTACTDGISIRYNPDFINAQSKSDVVFIFAHEATHIALKHNYRAVKLGMGKHCVPVWNIASDYVVNDALEKAGFDIPQNALKIPKKYEGKTTEIIYYDLLNQNNVKIDKCLADLKPNFDDQHDHIKHTDEMIKRCLSANIPHGGVVNHPELKKIIGDIQNKYIDWITLLRNFYSGFTEQLYSFRRPSRRSQEFYLPSICGDDSTINEVNVYVDCSGSITDKQYTIFINEIKNMFDDLQLSKLVLKTFSIDITGTYDFTDSKDIIKCSAKSDNGTSIKAVINDINKSDSMFNIVFTDGKFDKKPLKDFTKPNNKLFWILTENNFTPSKGFYCVLSENTNS